ncbi:MAG: PD-(D/E)XK nuclease family protein [Nanoarchaeota archaeon]|nr:PD-(D/E)XK nuclease family protein [Nanoarchaeota archaeon]MBU1270073.1 PD-(D/E)XK nuclease family protein [Nanoarchaeota archaeon]MBU1604998.1 PD-(D/E)XK nuclease family protein [Nanoarchaeota archaeon]MBU2443409.1 PD-(D/E)XK nuclease family protein [Nanoarchaeota archaeon]
MTVYSHSRISTFEQCKLKFKYKYIDKIEPLVKDTVETFLGSRVHEALEKLYQDLKFQKNPTKEELLVFLETNWHEKWNDEILIVRKEYTKENYLEMAKKFVSNYYDHYHPFDQAVTIGTEMYISIKLDEEGTYQLQGYVDRLDSNGETYEIHDYKTANSLPIQEYLDKDRQLALYAIAIKEQYNDAKAVKLVWHYLAFDKELQSQRTDDELEKLRYTIIEVIQEIEACKEFSSKVSALCDWCEYKNICPEWKHLYELEKKEDPTNDDGVKFVDEYSKLKMDESKIQRRIEELRNKILSFAEKKGINAVFGTEQRAKIWSRECDKFPKTTDFNYKDFVETVKKLGLWNEFSRIDSFKLEKAFENKELFGEIHDVLKMFSRKEQVERIYLGKKQ